MKNNISILVCATAFLFGCSVKSPKNAVTESSASMTEKTTISSGSPEKPDPAEEEKNKSDPGGKDISGIYQIISYDDGSGKSQSFNPGTDDSIIGSSSIVLKKDGTCEFNLPGMGERGCSWMDHKIQTDGAEISFSLNGKQLTINENNGTYVFEKTK